MRRIAFLTFEFVLASLLALTVGYPAAHSDPVSLDSVSIVSLTGRWEAAMPEGVQIEEWWLIEEGSLAGRGYFVKAGGDTSASEELELREMDGILTYIAIVAHNPAPVHFTLTRSDSTGWIFENPEHDFPRRLSYHFVGEDSLIVDVDDGKDSNPQGFRLKFRRNKGF